VALLCSEEAGWITGQLIAVEGRAGLMGATLSGDSTGDRRIGSKPMESIGPSPWVSSGANLAGSALLGKSRQKRPHAFARLIVPALLLGFQCR
jgi:hypothetical protein